MLYTKKDNLTIIETKGEEKAVSIKKIKEVLDKKPSNVIYVNNLGGGGYRHYKYGRCCKGI